MGILASESFPIPILSVGNLSTGGTGKTPHTEYIAQILHQTYGNVAILSRGYKRKTKGFIEVTSAHTYMDVGDEPCQYKRKFTDKGIIIAVDSNRRRGIRELLKLHPTLSAIILDDAYQHRWVKAGKNILLTDYYSPFYKDRIFPFGNLREPRKGAKRADMIIVTKSPPVISPLTRRDIMRRIPLKCQNSLLFSRIHYGLITHFLTKEVLDEKKTFSTVFMVTGIANPYPLSQHVSRFCTNLIQYNYPDHHVFSKNDMEKLRSEFENHLSSNKIIITTEKDMMRMISGDIAEVSKKLPIYYIPITIEFIGSYKEQFHKIIETYVRENQRNS